MVIYPGELEAAFNGFTDIAQMFPLYRGKGSKDRKDKSGQPVGYFKGSFKVYSQPEEDTTKFSNPPSTDPVEVIVRVYVIKVMHDIHASKLDHFLLTIVCMCMHCLMYS